MRLSVPAFDPPIRIRGCGAWHVGGRTERVDASTSTFITSTGETLDWPQDGHYSIGQLYAQAILPHDAWPDISLAFWHGGGMSGAEWDVTPDGRPGWLQMALADRFDCIVCDAAERGRAGIPHPAFTDEPPVFRSNELAWERFRIGPKGGYRPGGQAAQAHDGQIFPSDHFDAFAQQFTARWPGFSDHVRRAYAAFISDAGGGLVIVAHSEGARYALECAMQSAASIVAMVLIEPAGAPAQRSDWNRDQLRSIPLLSVWGDFIEHNERWRDLKARYEAFIQSSSILGHDTIHLNDIGLAGHSHFPMLDLGNDDVWRAISTWVVEVAAPAAAHTRPTMQAPPVANHDPDTRVASKRATSRRKP